MIYCSYYTINTPYEKVMDEFLLPSLKRWNLNFKVYALNDLGSWQENTSQKSELILYYLERFKEDIVFLDADCTIEQFPQLFARIPDDYDLAVHWLDWEKQYGKKNVPLELLTGTMMWRYNEKNLLLLKDWIETLKKESKWEQKVLQDVLKKHLEIVVFDLPYEYCAIRKTNGTVPCENPVIIHNQCSRKLRNRKNWK